MHLYQDAYGFTQLRLLVDVFEGWLGLLVLGVLAAGSAPRGLAAALRPAQRRRALLGLAAINPDAWIAEHNLDRYETTGRLDESYLLSLSADAVPVLVEPAGCRRRLPRRPVRRRRLARVEPGPGPGERRPRGQPRSPAHLVACPVELVEG